jgi:hypothetical protein
VADLEKELDQQHMAHTGTDAEALPVFALTAFLVGSAMIVIGTRRRSAAAVGLPPPWPPPSRPLTDVDYNRTKSSGHHTISKDSCGLSVDSQFVL